MTKDAPSPWGEGRGEGAGPVTKSRKSVAADVRRRILVWKSARFVPPPYVGGYFDNGPGMH